MRELTECQQRILAELDETWEDNVFSLLNATLAPTGAETDVKEFVGAVNDLVVRDFAFLGWETFYPRNRSILDKSASINLVSKLPDLFQFHKDVRLWKLRGGDMRIDRYPIAAVTDKGHEWGRGILNRRGFRWWTTE